MSLQTEKIKDISFTFDPSTRERYILERVVVDNIYGISEDVKDRVVIDIGAHIGALSLLAASKGAKVLAIEASWKNYQALEINVFENAQRANIVCKRNAISNTNGWQKLYLSDWCTGCNSLELNSNASLSADKYEWVTCETIETIFNKRQITNCKLLKLDCEGAEEFILPSVIENYSDIVESIAVEFHKQIFFNSIKDRLREKYPLAIEISPLEWKFEKYPENI